MSTQQQRILRLAPTKDSVLDRRVGVRGEIFYDDTNRVLRIFDGELLGGYELLRADLENIDVTILNSKLTNSTVQFGSTTVSLGGSSATLAGLTSVTATTFNGALTGNVTGNVLGNLTGNITLDGVTSTGATGTGQIVFDTEPTITGASLTNIAGMNFAAGVVVTEFSSDATLADNSTSTVPTESAVKGYVDAQHFYVGTTDISISRASASQTLTGISIDGNAATVTNGVYTNSSYANPSWITSLSLSKVGFTAGKSFTYDSAATPALAVKATAYTADFGATPVTSKSFTITDANATAQNSVMIYPVGDDEWEMDPIAYSARCNAGTITLYASTSHGPIKGTRSIRYVLV